MCDNSTWSNVIGKDNTTTIIKKKKKTDPLEARYLAAELLRAILPAGEMWSVVTESPRFNKTAAFSIGFTPGTSLSCMVEKQETVDLRDVQDIVLVLILNHKEPCTSSKNLMLIAKEFKPAFKTIYFFFLKTYYFYISKLLFMCRLLKGMQPNLFL